MSKPNKNSAPRKNPIVGASQEGKLVKPSSFCISTYSIAGANSDQKLAAIITPPVKPSATSKDFLLDELKKKTSPEPIAVINHVNSPAIRA